MKTTLVSNGSSKTTKSETNEGSKNRKIKIGRRRKTLLVWGFWVFITMSPLVVSLTMFVLRLGFDRTVWAGTLMVAFFGFFKAQESVARMRSVAEDKKIEHWLAAIRRKRTSKRLKAAQSPETADSQDAGKSSAWEVSRGWTQFRRPSFWRKDGQHALAQHTGDLFFLLGLDTKKTGYSENLGPLLLVNGNTVVAVVEDGARSASEAAENLSNLVAEKASCRGGILVSPSGFKLRTRNEFEDAPLILLDADNLAALAHRYIG